MIRVCPERDAICPHGMDCPYTVDSYRCNEPARAEYRAFVDRCNRITDRDIEDAERRLPSPPAAWGGGQMSCSITGC